MTSIVISHLICTVGLIGVILVLPIAYASVQANIRADVIQLELKEIADYVSSTYANTYFLVNFTDASMVTVKKALVFLPSTVQGSVFIIKINGNASEATNITVSLKDQSSTGAVSWLPTGLKGGNVNITSGGGTVLAGCQRNSTGVYILLDRGGLSQ